VSVIIDKYVTRLNAEDTEFWTVKEVIKFLLQENTQISFTNFYEVFLAKMQRERSKTHTNNYKVAFSSLRKFAGKEQFYFSEITSKLINAWIESLSHTKRAKNMYPYLISAVFKAGTLFYNDYERGIIKIKNQPFVHVKIPDAETSNKRALEIEYLRKIFDYDLSKLEKTDERILGKDIAMLIFCLAGINVRDLFLMRDTNFINGKLCYSRAKTKGKRKDKAYIEINVPEMILPLFEKYRGNNGSLFNFAEKYRYGNILLLVVNRVLKQIAGELQIPENVTTYVFRHSWATIAQNDCGATTALVAFALNHSTEYRVTKGYIKTDFSPIDRLNEKVLEFVFG
jgi:integrase